MRSHPANILPLAFPENNLDGTTAQISGYRQPRTQLHWIPSVLCIEILNLRLG